MVNCIELYGVNACNWSIVILWQPLSLFNASKTWCTYVQPHPIHIIITDAVTTTITATTNTHSSATMKNWGVEVKMKIWYHSHKIIIHIKAQFGRIDAYPGTIYHIHNTKSPRGQLSGQIYRRHTEKQSIIESFKRNRINVLYCVRACAWITFTYW